MNIIEACNCARNGDRIFRSPYPLIVLRIAFGGVEHYLYDITNEGSDYPLSVEDIEANDWEVVK